MSMPGLRFKSIAILVFLSIILSACNFPGVGPSEAENNLAARETSVAQTLTALSITTVAPTDSPIPPSPTASQTIVILPSPSATNTLFVLRTQPPLPAATQPIIRTPGLPTIQADINTNCREGPHPLYRVLGYLLVGQISTVHGRNNSYDNPWWFIENPKKPGEYCWVWGETTRVEGDITMLPIITPPPPPTLTPTQAQTIFVYYSNVHDCGGMPTAIFQVNNESSAEIKSTVMTLTDLNTNLPLYGPDISNSPFMATANNCPPGGSNLPSGYTGFLGGPLGLALSGHVARADIQLCTEKNKGGECVTASVQFAIP